MNLYPVTAFIRHLLTARSAAGHGVHSPFVFDFLTTVVSGGSDTLITREVESLRREMLADRRIVRVTDLGAGSVIHKGEERRVSEIASAAALPARYVALLSRISGATQLISQHRVNPGIQSYEAYSQRDSGESQKSGVNPGIQSDEAYSQLDSGESKQSGVNPGIQSDKAFSQLDSGESQQSGVNPMMHSDAADGNQISGEVHRSGIGPSLRADVADGQEYLQGVPPDLREDIAVEANVFSKKEQLEAKNKKDHSNSEGREVSARESHQASESYDKATGDRSIAEGSRDSVESHSLGQEQGGSQAGGQDNGELSQEQVKLSQKHATLQVKPGTGGPGIILELGTSLGISTLALALAAPERRVVSVEGCPALAAIARDNLTRHGAANAEILNMEFSEALSLLSKEGTKVSLAFIDGNHRGEAMKQYVSKISTMGDEMIIVADDIHLNRDMYNTWRFLVDTALQVAASRKVPSGAEIMPPEHPGIAPATAEKMPPAHPGKAPVTAEKMPPAHPGTATATIETLRFGLIFCRRSLTPRHYRIRY